MSITLSNVVMFSKESEGLIVMIIRLNAQSVSKKIQNVFIRYLAAQIVIIVYHALIVVEVFNK